MEKQVSIKKNMVLNTFYQMLTLITPLITAPYTARIFGADGVGIQSYTNSIVSYFTLIATLGTATYGQRRIAMVRDNKAEASKTFLEIEILRVITTFVSLCVWVVVILSSETYGIYYSVLSITLIAVAFDISWFYAGYECFQFIVIRNTIIRFIGIAILFLLIDEKSDLLLYMGLSATTGLLGNLSMWTYLPKFLVSVNIKKLQIFRHCKETIVYFIPAVAVQVYTVLDKTMLGWILNNTYEIGYYEQAHKIVNILKAVVLSINTVMFARMSYLFKTNRMDEIKNRLHKSLDFILFLSMPMVAGVIGIANEFVPIFFGAGYDKVIPLLQRYSLLIIVIGISNCLGQQFLSPTGKQAKSNKVVIVGAVLNLVFNVVLIPRGGAMGAAIGSIVSEIFIAVVYYVLCRKIVDLKLLRGNFLKRIIAAVGMLLAINVVRNLEMDMMILLLLEITIGGIVYILISVLLKDTTVLMMLCEANKLIKHK
jgi:O-antigen/teichoic acid export membrane protein